MITNIDIYNTIKEFFLVHNFCKTLKLDLRSSKTPFNFNSVNPKPLLAVNLKLQ